MALGEIRTIDGRDVRISGPLYPDAWFYTSLDGSVPLGAARHDQFSPPVGRPTPEPGLVIETQVPVGGGQAPSIPTPAKGDGAGALRTPLAYTSDTLARLWEWLRRQTGALWDAIQQLASRLGIPAVLLAAAFAAAGLLLLASATRGSRR